MSKFKSERRTTFSVLKKSKKVGLTTLQNNVTGQIFQTPHFHDDDEVGDLYFYLYNPNNDNSYFGDESADSESFTQQIEDEQNQRQVEQSFEMQTQYYDELDSLKRTDIFKQFLNSQQNHQIFQFYHKGIVEFGEWFYSLKVNIDPVYLRFYIKLMFQHPQVPFVYYLLEYYELIGDLEMYENNNLGFINLTRFFRQFIQAKRKEESQKIENRIKDLIPHVDILFWEVCKFATQNLSVCCDTYFLQTIVSVYVIAFLGGSCYSGIQLKSLPFCIVLRAAIHTFKNISSQKVDEYLMKASLLLGIRYERLKEMTFSFETIIPI